MPNAYARYRDERAKAMELEQLLKEHCPGGKATDPTGGALFAKADGKLVEAVARTFRRRDELCFFLLFHRAGVFSEEELAEHDAHPISIRLEEESPDWPDDTPRAGTALPGEDATFAARYLPETYAGYQRLGGLFDEGARQYAELRRTALALDAPRARNELAMFKIRLAVIQTLLERLKKDFSVRRVLHSLGETEAGSLADWDQAKAVEIQERERELAVKAYVDLVAKRRFLTLSLPGGAEMEMVWCPPGAFMMGSPPGEKGRSSDETRRQVMLTRGFFMARTEVTEQQWKSVMGYYPGEKPLEVAIHFGTDVAPVKDVTWHEARAFCLEVGLELPTEAEWEYACRAGSGGPYAGNGRLEEMGWFDCRGDGNAVFPVGRKKANAWGLYDMHGNVWEWCADWYGDYSNHAMVNPQGPHSGSRRVMRGGCLSDEARDCRSATRSCASPDDGDGLCGLRPVIHLD